MELQRGGCPIFLRHCKELTRLYGISLLGILEPRVSGSKAQNVISKLGFSNQFVIEANGFAGGIWLLWKDDVCSVSIFDSSEFFIHTRVTVLALNKTFFFTVVYGIPQLARRIILWDQHRSIAASVNEAWAVSGDFNAYSCTAEKLGGSNYNWASMKRFNDCCMTVASWTWASRARASLGKEGM